MFSNLSGLMWMGPNSLVSHHDWGLGSEGRDLHYKSDLGVITKDVQCMLTAGCILYPKP